MLQEAVFPAVARIAAKKGDIDHLRKLRSVVSCLYLKSTWRNFKFSFL